MTGAEALGFAVAHLTEREAVVERNMLLTTAIEHGAGNVAPDAVLQAFENELAKGRLLETTDGRLTTAKMLSSEEWLLDTIKDHQQKAPGIAGADAVDVRLAGVEERAGRPMTAGQRETFETHELINISAASPWTPTGLLATSRPDWLFFSVPNTGTFYVTVYASDDR